GLQRRRERRLGHVLRRAGRKRRRSADRATSARRADLLDRAFRFAGVSNIDQLVRELHAARPYARSQRTFARRRGASSMSLSDRFFADVARMGQRRRTNPEHYLVVWCSESDLDPTAKNRIGARGLNQMTPGTLQGLGAPEDFEKLSAEEQLPW